VDPAASRLAAGLAGKLIPAVPVPHAADGIFDPAAQRQYAAWMARQPIGGVAAWVHTGRGLYLGGEVASNVLESWRAALPAPLLLIAGAGARPRERKGTRGRTRTTPPADPVGLTAFVIQSTLEMAREAKQHGADAILAFPPVLLRDLDDRDRRVVEVHAALAEVGLPVLAFFLYEAAGGISYSERALDRILALPHVAGIKVATLDSVMTFQEVARRVPEGKLLISGEDRFLGYSLMAGARSALIGLGAARTKLTAELLASHAASDWERFHALSSVVDRLAAATFREPMDGYIRRMLHILARDGVVPAQFAHDPWGPGVADWQLAELDTLLATLK
jgi:4-hydroxy-tetrahydrodipicolinate synthase